MTKYSGRCSCDEIEYTISREPFFTHACHCKLCQRYTASGFVVHSMIETINFRLKSGTLKHTTGPSGSGGGHTVFRCSQCGDQIYSHVFRNPKITVLKTTTLDDPNLFPPQAHIYVKSKLNWLKLDDGIPKFDEFYDRETIYPPESLDRRKKVI